MYCEKCGRLFEENASLCPACGSRKIRYPKVNDQCFLVEKASIWGEMLADVLNQKGLTFLKEPVLGAGMALRLGAGMERYRFYVPYAQLTEAQAVVSDLFPEEN